MVGEFVNWSTCRRACECNIKIIIKKFIKKLDNNNALNYNDIQKVINY